MRRLARWLLNALTALSLLMTVAVAWGWLRSYWVCDLVSYSTFSREIRFDPNNPVSPRPVVRVGFWYCYSGVGGVMVLRDAMDCIPDTDTTSSGLRWEALATHHYLTLPARIREPDQRQFSAYHWGGFEYLNAQGGFMPTNSHRGVVVPYWACLVALLLAPGLQWCSGLRRGRPPGRCRGCSYDLTGNVSGVCPECGTAITKGNG